MKLRMLLLILLAAVAVPSLARAQAESREGIYLQNQIQELKRDIQGLRDAMNRGGNIGASALGGGRPSAPPANADVATALLERVARLEDDIRQLRGQIDETANAQKRLGEDLSKQIEDLNFKISPGGGCRGRPHVDPPVPARPDPC